MKRLPAACLLLFAACASEAPSSTSFDRSGGYAVVTVHGDGFGALDGERLPIDAIVLKLRHRTRALPADQLERFVVRLLVADGIGADASKRVQADLHRLLEELNVMDVGQVEYL